MDLKKLEKHIADNIKVIIAIDGPSAAGKSSLGYLLKERYDGLLIKTDDYFLHPSRKTEERLNEVGGNLDYERLLEEVFTNVNEPTIQSNHFNCIKNILENREPLVNKDILIVEGVYSLHPMFLKYYTFKIFMDVEKDTQLKRIKERNGDVMLQRWINEWIPLEDKYFVEIDAKTIADLVIKT